jgi:predicted transcriptional regulator
MIGDQTRADEANRILRDRDKRYKLFPGELFDEFAWNMMLHLFVALADNEQMSESRLIELVKIPVSVGRRWIALLVNDGQVEPREDGRDIILTPAAVGRLREYLGS